MPRILKKMFKYKCMEIMCNTVHRQDKWPEHCKKKHAYKFKNNMNIKYKVVEVKEGNGPFIPYTEENQDHQTHEASINILTSTTENLPAQASANLLQPRTEKR